MLTVSCLFGFGGLRDKFNYISSSASSGIWLSSAEASFSFARSLQTLGRRDDLDREGGFSRGSEGVFADVNRAGLLVVGEMGVVGVVEDVALAEE